MKSSNLITQLFETLTDHANKSIPDYQEDMKVFNKAIEDIMLVLRYDNVDQSADIAYDLTQLKKRIKNLKWQDLNIAGKVQLRSNKCERAVELLNEMDMSERQNR